ncbi:hypothetical protein SpCBS45565_g00531 [Spizellomyces sp. 'palustris']|nr:hypothetical protein SpCBS45565_g00531 [Spizellomyces sp. 'palustris']
MPTVDAMVGMPTAPTHLSARALRRAKPTAAFRANIGALGADPAQRLAAMLNKQAALHSVAATSSIMEALKTKDSSNTASAGQGTLLAVVEEGEDEESHR